MAYIHPTDERILDFSKKHSDNGDDLESICSKILAWFDCNVEYTRLNAPLFPPAKKRFGFACNEGGNLRRLFQFACFDVFGTGV